MEQFNSQRSPEIPFIEQQINYSRFSPKQHIRFYGISCILNIPIKDLEDIFYDVPGQSETDIILPYLNNKYKLSLGDNDILNFIINVVGINRFLLYSICADYDDFYIGLTTFQACKIILNKILSNGTIDNIRGYPRMLNYTGNNNLQRYSDSNINCLPIKSHSSIGKSNYLSIINSTKFRNAVNKNDNEILLYHACSWQSFESILVWIDPTASRNEPTDFGKNNFYTTDSFKSAFIWSSRESQGSIIVFKIPIDLIDLSVDPDKILKFNHTENLNFWKTLVYKCRKPLSFGTGMRSQILHKNFITDVDRNEFISGPILSSRDISSEDEADYITYSNGEIPYQLSFKSQRICDILHNYISLVLCFEEKE